MKMQDYESIKKWILQSFKLHGFSVRADAASFLAEQFLYIPDCKRKEKLEKITDQLRLLNLETPVVDKEQLEQCYKESLLEKPSSETVWSIIDAFKIPCFVYNREKCKYEKDETVTSKGLFTHPISKSFMRRRLYYSIMQKTLKHSALKQTFTSNGKSFQFTLKTVEWYLCATEKIEHAVIIGLLVQKNDGKYAVEDISGTLDIDISKTNYAEGLFTEHCFVFLEGTYQDKVFYVLNFGLPPPEPSKASRPYFGDVNIFGGPSEYSLRESKALQKIELRNSDAMIVFVSDVWLDKPEVLDKLEVLFSGYSDYPPFAFVLLGNFLSSQKAAHHGEELRRGFTALGRIIEDQPTIRKNSRFVIVPGPLDVGAPRILPRPPLSRYLVQGLLSRVPKVELASNPCRIQYCTKEIVVIREDLMTKLCRNTIHFPDDGPEKIAQHFTKTILSQGNLAPMSLLVCPVYWNYSHALDLYPLPDLVVASDQYNSFTECYMDCTVTSPGCFPKEKFSFKVYFPGKNEVEDSCIPEET